MKQNECWEKQVEENAVEVAAEQALPQRPVVTPVVEEVSLIDQGLIFMTGDYQRAGKAFEAALVEDPYNRKAGVS